MNYPLISEYVEAIKAAADKFEQLKHLRPVLGENGEPVMTSGNFAVVFKMKDEQTGKLHAVKCFLKEQEGRAEAYRQIAEELEYVSSTFLTPIKYLDKELFVDSANSEDSEFPVLLMDWVEGQTLDKYIREHIDDQYELSLLAYQFSRLAMWLMPQPFAHGDLKPDNILVKEDGTLVLVDYDGMYVPAMKGQKARELGSPDFRHPSRTEEVFDEHIDDFSLASILLSLKAIALQPSLLEEYGASDRLLFSENDYRNLSGSSALGALQPLMQDAELASLYSLYILALSQNNLSQVSFRLFNLSKPDRFQYEEENLSTEVTDEDKEYIEKYGKNKSEYLKENFNEVNTLTAVCLKNVYDFYQYEDYSELEVGKTYQVTHIGVFRSSTRIMLNGFGNKQYRSTCFEIYENGESINKTYAKDPRFEAPYLRERYKRYHFELSNDPIEEKNLSTEVTDEDLANAWTDEFGVKYSANRKRLLWAPSNIQTYSIKEGTIIICDRAFNDSPNSGNTQLISVVIPESVTHIGNSAFQNCFSLETITIPNSVQYIGNAAFSHCYNINIAIPKSVKYIGSGAFYNCRSLTSISIPMDLNKIEDFTFANCYSLKSIHMPDSLLEIGDSAFATCFGLEKVIIADSVKSIGDKAFFECYALSEIVISKSIEHIGNYAFEDCRSLQNIDIPKTLKNLGEGAFEYCESLISIDIPDSITSVGKKAFCGCHSLSQVKLPDTITLIDEYAFETCGLSQIDIPQSLLEIKDFAFSGCPIKYINIPESVSTIGNSVFFGCTELSDIHFSSTPLSFGKEVFDLCTYLKKIIIPIGSKKIFEELLPEYKDKLVEQERGWSVKDTRSFSPDEIAAVARAEVVPSQYGNSVCFFMNGGGQTYIPLLNYSSLTIGDSVDLKTAKLVTLCREGDDDIYRVIEK